MALTECSVDTNNIQNLPDAPTLDPQELKTLFDKSGADIKKYLNEILTKEIDQLIENEKKNITESIDKKILEDNKKKYHIGKIVIETENINPVTYLNFGTWEYWGKGKVPVGVDEYDEDFATVEKTGGEKEHTLIIDEIPSHAHSKGQEIGAGGETVWGYSREYNSNMGNVFTDYVGGNKAHNNMQPYITCYMWKRIS